MHSNKRLFRSLFPGMKIDPKDPLGILIEIDQYLLPWICYTLAKDLDHWTECERQGVTRGTKLALEDAHSFALFVHDWIEDESARTPIPPLGPKQLRAG